MIAVTEPYLAHISARLDRLDQQARRIRISAIRMTCYLAIQDEQRRESAIQACIERGLAESPHQTLAQDIQRVIAEVSL